MHMSSLAVFEHVINDRLYRLEVMNGSPFQDVYTALDEFKKAVDVAKVEWEKAKAESAAKQEEAPKDS
jgi:hypothetical protein